MVKFRALTCEHTFLVNLYCILYTRSEDYHTPIGHNKLIKYPVSRGQKLAAYLKSDKTALKRTPQPSEVKYLTLDLISAVVGAPGPGRRPLGCPRMSAGACLWGCVGECLLFLLCVECF